MEFTREEKLSFMKSLMWDYNIPPELIQTQLWLAKPFDLEKFKNHLQIVSDDFLLARENSLGKDKKHVTEAKPSIT